jgi:hypothetical protein
VSKKGLIDRSSSLLEGFTPIRIPERIYLSDGIVDGGIPSALAVQHF